MPIIPHEKFLQFVWQHQLFNQTSLKLTNGDELRIVFVGNINKNQGPDFLLATIFINNVKLVGNIEIHVNSEDWNKHKHSEDENYKSVILHVVWQNNSQQNSHLPLLELQGKVPLQVMQQYENLMQAKSKIPCENFLPALTNLAWLSWKERLLAEKLEEKKEIILSFLKQTNQHWEEVFWWMLAKNFGIKINQDYCQHIAQQIPTTILAKHKHNCTQVEAMLFGVGNLLPTHQGDDYVENLKHEFDFLQAKYKLKQTVFKPMFLRLRPISFPTVRLALLAQLICNSKHLFSVIIETERIAELYKLFQVTASQYWNTHYVFNQSSVNKPKKMGNDLIDNIVINTVIPMLFAYGKQMHKPLITEKAYWWLTQIKPEKNNIVNAWKERNMPVNNAFDSQALLYLQKKYCSHLNCLSCAVGTKILKQQ